MNDKNNLWKDFGIGEGGKVIDLLCKYLSTDASGALHWLERNYGLCAGKSKNPTEGIYEAEKSRFEILQVHPIQSQSLTYYLYQRGIHADWPKNTCRKRGIMIIKQAKSSSDSACKTALEGMRSETNTWRRLLLPRTLRNPGINIKILRKSRRGAHQCSCLWRVHRLSDLFGDHGNKSKLSYLYSTQQHHHERKSRRMDAKVHSK